MNFGNQPRSRIKLQIYENSLLPLCCAECGITEWQGKTLSLHLDHINGVNNDNRLENLRLLCPNCHSLTETYCGKANGLAGHYGKGKYKVSDDQLVEAIRNASSIKEALDSVGLSGAGNYNRVKRLAEKYQLTHILRLVMIQTNNKEKTAALRTANIDFTKHGWVSKASTILGITPQKTRKYIERNCPDLLDNAHRRKTDE